MESKKKVIKSKALPSKEMIICYTGIGANKSGIHTNNEFKKIISKQKLCLTNCPKTLEEWVDWYGAGKKTKTQCSKVVKLNKIITSKNVSVGKANKQVAKCIKNKCDDLKTNEKCINLRCKKETKNLVKANIILKKASEKASREWMK
jgi:hypothetical protein